MVAHVWMGWVTTRVCVWMDSGDDTVRRTLMNVRVIHVKMAQRATIMSTRTRVSVRWASVVLTVRPTTMTAHQGESKY